MKTLVVYDSVYGNTEIIAQAIAAAIPGDVQVLRVGQAKPADLKVVDLLIVGSPTHGALPTEAVQDLLQKLGSPARIVHQHSLADARQSRPLDRQARSA
jgi:flavodoxin